MEIESGFGTNPLDWVATDDNVPPVEEQVRELARELALDPWPSLRIAQALGERAASTFGVVGIDIVKF